MITQEQQKLGEELIQTLAQRAWESSAFKEQLVKNPVSTIESVTGYKMQSNSKIIVEDQTNDSFIYLNIPRKVDVESIELTDEQLEMVSGGEGPILIACGVMALVGGAFAFGYSVGKDMAANHK